METEVSTELQRLSQLLQQSWKMVRTPRMKTVLKVQNVACDAMRDYLKSEDFIELLPPIIGPVTDPGIRGAKQVTFDYYGREYKVMSSAILYKQAAMSGLGKIFFMSPNIRLEPLDSTLTGRHLTEFVQLDLEIAEANYFDAMSVAEKLLCEAVNVVRDSCAKELEELGRRIPAISPPFKKLTYDEALEYLRRVGLKVRYGVEIPWYGEHLLSKLVGEPFFIIDYPRGARGFYDREDDNRPGILRDFDLIYPEGFGEAASGAEREFRYERVLARMRENGEDPRKYAWYLEMLREGIPPSAGFGIGVERLTRFLCGLDSVIEARLCPKVAGIHSP
ncbi:MAG: asparagine synthetase A [Nitrososphaerota archaeon]|nr:asparagine synthetase A [Candidatus Calditenuaceae archaeon]MDW8073345.1 asparagine synthetase A [Nitrososphaerota archaeon]